VGALLEDALTQTPTVYGPGYPRATDDINRDLFPRDEYLVGARFRAGGSAP
jgi:hypothetical protein